ncbi:hypothetical protein IGB42_04277 [Andreprevotia sp. IGB-42]|uniref:hypothetical protein n=1 Tax=Andreprevotia sp. IGB-42 TaxID=2497473 RepID=UPI001356CE2A|nr:hypothetical protein [Andreprevotia sp. IGB-42]KAF0811255.1 hypothetical protein IGB42_04277 [Andreprevotia sp. IGB-42]
MTFNNFLILIVASFIFSVPYAVGAELCDKAKPVRIESEDELAELIGSEGYSKQVRQYFFCKKIKYNRLMIDFVDFLLESDGPTRDEQTFSINNLNYLANRAKYPPAMQYVADCLARFVSNKYDIAVCPSKAFVFYAEDRKKALIMYNLAARRGDDKSMRALALEYLRKKNYVEAAKYAYLQSFCGYNNIDFLSDVLRDVRLEVGVRSDEVIRDGVQRALDAINGKKINDFCFLRFQ